MHSKLRKFIRFMQEKIFQCFNILIALRCSFDYNNIESEEKSIKMASLFQSLMTGLLNLVDMLKELFCDSSFCNCCSCCSKKKADENEIDYETINIEIEKRTKDLLLQKKIKLKLLNETKKDSQDYSNTLSEYKTMKNLENEINMIKIN